MRMARRQEMLKSGKRALQEGETMLLPAEEGEEGGREAEHR